MSLDKSPQLTPQRLAANRQNAQHSTGPRTAGGKKRSSRNSRQHGLYSNARFFWDAAIALGEDPREFERLLKLDLARQPTCGCMQGRTLKSGIRGEHERHQGSMGIRLHVCSCRRYGNPPRRELRHLRDDALSPAFGGGHRSRDPESGDMPDAPLGRLESRNGIWKAAASQVLPPHSTGVRSSL